MTEAQRQIKVEMAAHALRLSFILFLALSLWLVASTVFRDMLLSDEYLTGDDFGIAGVVGEADADEDGMDDQSDILSSAKEYIATEPRYHSDYFTGGWPTDGTGVCTDVVAYALLGSGYDLRALVDADIRLNPSEYAVAKPDPNIDYRRVRNLKVFFNRHATSLTTDLSDISEWQGGDIVCYGDHIGIVSDRRNSDGVPYIIHHGSPWQMDYEENRLGDWGGPECHWRWELR